MLPLPLALTFAVADKLRQIPVQFWINLVLCILGAIIVVRFWRALGKVNGFMPWLAVLITVSMILSYWTYNRTEPRFLSPLVDKLALVLPTKSKHDMELERMRQNRD